MTRSMLASSRRLLIADAVDNFKEDKMVALRKTTMKQLAFIHTLLTCITSKIYTEKVQKNIRKLRKSQKKIEGQHYNRLLAEWETIREDLSMTITDKVIAATKKRLRKDVTTTGPENIWYIYSVANYLALPT